VSTFEGYPSETLAFLAALPSRSPDWFKANRKTYEELLVGPTKAFVSTLGDELQERRPDITAQPKTNGSIAPINNDLRFAPDKSPYKDNVLLRFWEGPNKKTAPTLFVRISPDGIGFASGVLPADLKRWREVIDSPHGAVIANEVSALAKAKSADVAGVGLKKVPAPYPADHPQAQLLRHKMLQVRWQEAVPASIHKPMFVDWCGRRLDQATALHEALVEAKL
jgi:uncharacterized protein (TIGR02453 family)